MKKNWNLIIKKQFLYLMTSVLIIIAISSVFMSDYIYSRMLFGAKESCFFFVTEYNQSAIFLLAWLFIAIAITTLILSINMFFKILSLE